MSPESPVYEIGSPIFTKSTVRLGSGKEFTVVANGASAQNKYIQSARLNGKSLDRPWFQQSDIRMENCWSWRWEINRMCSGAVVRRMLRPR
ncbi:MAG TPA: glycoside hydrolase domain-containing protein [Edaphobacter sp.]